MQQTNDTTLQQIVAVKSKATAGSADGINFVSTISGFKVQVGTNANGTGVGSQGTVVSSATAGTGSTADIGTQANASAAVSALESAVSSLGTAQAVVGKGQNQFSFAVNLASSQLTNLAAAMKAPVCPDARPFHEALVAANPERLVWGGDWPHPRVEGEMPDAGHLFELFQQWTPDLPTQHRILVTNPAKLYGFPN